MFYLISRKQKYLYSIHLNFLDLLNCIHYDSKKNFLNLRLLNFGNFTINALNLHFHYMVLETTSNFLKK